MYVGGTVAKLRDPPLSWYNVEPLVSKKSTWDCCLLRGRHSLVIFEHGIVHILIRREPRPGCESFDQEDIQELASGYS